MKLHKAICMPLAPAVPARLGRPSRARRHSGGQYAEACTGTLISAELQIQVAPSDALDETFG